jgi:hypothetical protein
LTIQSLDSEPLDLTVLRDIHFGNTKVDLNVCEGDKAHYYKPKDGKAPDLTSNYASVVLTPNENGNNTDLDL